MLAIDHRDPQWSMLSNFLGAYFHQDFDAEYAEPWDAVLDYRRGATGARRATVANQIRHLVAISDDDQDIEAAVDSLGMHYSPTYDGYSSYRVWLTAVADFLDDPEAHPGPPERDAPMPG